MKYLSAMTVISILNHKGGVGKTTVTINLASGLAKRGHKVLVIDMDVQNQVVRAYTNSETTDGVGPVLLGEKAIGDVVVAATDEGVDVVPAGVELRRVMTQLVTEPRNDSRLTMALRGLTGYDFVLIDNGPGASILTMNSLFASHHVLAPITAEMLALNGVALLEDTWRQVTKLHDDIDFLGTVLNQYDKRYAISAIVEARLREMEGLHLMDAKIGTNARFKEIPGHGASIYAVKDKRGMADFDGLVDEVLGRLAAANA